MKRTNFTTAIIGGGAAGLMLACSLSQKQGKIALFERGERVGRKLSATGNGQGNITNVHAESTAYFSSTAIGATRAQEIIKCYPHQSLINFFEDMGLLLMADERGRVYPCSRQASALTDALRFYIEQKGVQTYTNTQVLALEKHDNYFILHCNGQTFTAENVVLCTGGKAAKNFGTDGSAYALAQAFGHTVTNLYPSLVQLKTSTEHIKTLKGIRVNAAALTARVNGKPLASVTGDVIFTDYGISGDAVFRLSAFLSDKTAEDVTVDIDFLPHVSKEKLLQAMQEKRAVFPALAENELLFGLVNNQIGRAIMRRAGGDLQKAVTLLKAFPLTVTGTLGFDYAQVTKGGVPIEETDEHLQSRFTKGLYFAGEILDVDGECGGFNLQWAYSSARTVATALNEKSEGQV